MLGHEVIDGSGVAVGKIVDTWPFDGGEVELVVVRLYGTFGGKRMLAVEDLWSDGFFIRTPFAAWQVEDSPPLATRATAADDPYRARSYWRFAEPAGTFAARKLSAGWRLNSGCCGTGRPCRMTRSPTPIAS